MAGQLQERIWDAGLNHRLTDRWLYANQLSAGLSGAVKTALQQDGFALFRDFASADDDTSIIAERLTGLANELGIPIAQNEKGIVVDDVRDFSDSEPFDNRGYRSKGELTPHTDPATLILLYCVNPARSGGENQLVQIAAIHAVMAERYPQYLPHLMAGYRYWLPSETVPGEGVISDWARPILASAQGVVSCVYYRPYIERAAQLLGQPLTTVQVEALDCFDSLAASPELQVQFTLHSGDAMVLHNRAVMHARSDYEDWPDSARRRHLLRIWIDAPDLRRIPSEHQLGDIFANRITAGQSELAKAKEV